MAERAAQATTILCVHDESSGSYFRRLILEQHGYRVLPATSAAQALKLLVENEVQLVITNEEFGRDAGQSLAAEVKRMRPDVPVLMVGLSSQQRGAADEKIDGIVPPSQLLEEVHRLLDTRPQVNENSLLPMNRAVPAFPDGSEEATLKSLLAEIVDGSEDAILSKTLDGTITSWNRAAEHMYGYSAREIVGRNVTLLLPPDRPNEVHEILVKLQRGERVAHFDTKRMTKDGRILDVSLSISPIRDGNGRIVGASTITRDVTQLKLAERALHSTEKLAVAGRMAATVAHEINNPLEAISNIFYLLKQDKSLGELARNFVKTGEEELRRITQITRLTLGFHRDRTNAVTRVQVPELIDNVLTLYRRKIEALGVKVETQVDSKGEVLGNSGELRQVFSNLVVNAIEALSVRGDRLILRVRDAEWRGVPGIRVSIADNGPGIAPEIRRRLFEPFFTTKGSKGTGIGLWVSRGIVSKHGGTIQLKSQTKRDHPGTVFSIFLPHDSTKPVEKPRQVQQMPKPEEPEQGLRRAS